jgi:predicted nucleic acid-binding protein
VILADTSVWIDHLRIGESMLADLLDQGQVVIHPFVLGELSLGNLANRELVLGALADLPRVEMASDSEVLGFIETAGLYGLGIGYVDAHLLAATRLSPGVTLWTRDRRLRSSADAAQVTSFNDR